MRKIEVVVSPDCVQAVSEALRRAKVSPLQASDLTIFDAERSPEGRYRGAVYAVGRKRVKLELLLEDHEVPFAIEAIREGIDPISDGEAQLVVLDVREIVRLGMTRWERPRLAIR